jgi:predicted DNA-binding protein (UPF0251 family)
MLIIKIGGGMMSRPWICRRVGREPEAAYFKPRGIPVSRLEEEVLGIDELESLRLADLLGLYQEEAASRMNVSRQTFGRIVESARRKVAGALVNGKALKIEGGEIAMMTDTRKFRCSDCGHAWEIPHGTGRPEGCPSCKSANFHRVEPERGFGRRFRGGRGRGCGRPVS